MDEDGVKIHTKLRWFLQALLISAVMLAPAWGQIHKTIHGLKSNVASEQSLFSEHAEGSVVCQALDHLGSGEAAPAFEVQGSSTEPASNVRWAFTAPRVETLTLSFSARAPPAFLE
jgi:hypothetical protein